VIGVRDGTFSAREAAEAFVDAVAAGKGLNCLAGRDPRACLAAADAADRDRAAGTLKPLSGVPLGIKDLFCTAGVPTTAASAILDGFVPRYESTVTAQLFAAGAGMLGKLNMDQFAMGSSNETSAYGNVISPWQRNDGGNAPLAPGGSSGGSAAAIAARMAPGATGTDTGGSIRQPASFVGISGIKPTYGRCSRWGVVAFASSLDQAGPMARSVRDCAVLLEADVGFDPKDSTSLELPVPAWKPDMTSDLRVTIGVPKGISVVNMPPEIDALWDSGIAYLRDAGAEIVEVSLPHTRYALPAYYIIAPARRRPTSPAMTACATASACLPDGANLQEMYAATRRCRLRAEVKRRILIGTYVLSAAITTPITRRRRRCGR
jgi:aspartyl-tRNA(Asn)/glutamyl-tRNA(Gln) amidotransferase subunit A